MTAPEVLHDRKRTVRDRLRGLPPVGQRITRTVCSVMLIFLIFQLMGVKRTPLYGAIAAIQCVQSDPSQLKRVGKNRTAGTFIGAFFGIIILILTTYVFPDVQWTPLYFFIIALMILPVIYSTILLKLTATAYFSCVVFLSITVVSRDYMDPFTFTFFRTFDTLMGVAAAMICVSAHLPRQCRNDILFVSDLDDTLVSMKDKLSPYSQVTLNRMIQKGAQFTVTTRRTPAALLPLLEAVDLRLPIIAMDGAVLYDIRENRYCLEHVIGPATTHSIAEFLEQNGYHYYENVILDDVLLIYCNEFRTDAQRQAYEALRQSPYRNFIHREAPENASAVYFLLMEPEEQIDQVEQLLKAQPFAGRLRFMRDKAPVDGYCYLKLYSKNATRNNMIDYLKQQQRSDQIITFGTVFGQCDVIIRENNGNLMVKTMKKLYEPIKWKKLN